LLYSAETPAAPESCMRRINGSAHYKVFGWSVTGKSTPYLIPMTLINLSSLIILVYAMLISDHGSKMLPLFNPLKPEALIRENDPHISPIDTKQSRFWKTKVVYAKGDNGRYAFQVKRPSVSLFPSSLLHVFEISNCQYFKGRD
jgi:hypothetical protein